MHTKNITMLITAMTLMEFCLAHNMMKDTKHNFHHYVLSYVLLRLFLLRLFFRVSTWRCVFSLKKTHGVSYVRTQTPQLVVKTSFSCSTVLTAITTMHLVYQIPVPFVYVPIYCDHTWSSKSNNFQKGNFCMRAISPYTNVRIYHTLCVAPCSRGFVGIARCRTRREGDWSVSH